MGNELIEMKRLLTKTSHTKDEIVHLMTLFRIHLEKQNLKEQFLLLNLYCNWTVHPKLTALAAARILETLADILLVFFKDPKNQPYDEPLSELCNQISNALLMPGLRKEFIEFVDKCNLPKLTFVEADRWIQFFTILADIIVERPLEFPDATKLKSGSEIKKVYDSIQSKAKGLTFNLVGFSFSRAPTSNKDVERLVWKLHIALPPDGRVVFIRAPIKINNIT